MTKEPKVSVLLAMSSWFRKRVLDMESEALGLIPTGGKFYYRIFLFSRSKVSDANIANVENSTA